MKALIFDFDGVLADSFDAFYQLIQASFSSVGLKLTENQYRDFLLGNVHSAFRKMILEDEYYQEFLEFRRQHFDQYYSTVKLFPEVSEFVKKVFGKCPLAIASSGKPEHIVRLLLAAGIRDNFKAISANEQLSKEAMILEMLDQLQVHPNEAAFISDTVGDLKLARRLDLQAIAVSWGFHGAETLKSVKPDFLAADFNKLLRYFGA